MSKSTYSDTSMATLLNGKGRSRYRKKRVRGRGFFDTLKSIGNAINSGLQKSKILSTVAGIAPIPYNSQVSSVLKNVGYGRRVLRKRMKRSGLGKRRKRVGIRI